MKSYHGLRIQEGHKVSGFLKIPKTSILVVYSEALLKGNANMVYYVDLMFPNGDVINAIKRKIQNFRIYFQFYKYYIQKQADYQILQMEYLYNIDKILVINREKLIIANLFTMKAEFTLTFEQIVSASLIQKTDYIIITMDYQISIFDTKEKKIRQTIDKQYDKLDHEIKFQFSRLYTLQTKEEVIIASLTKGLQIWGFNLTTFIPQFHAQLLDQLKEEGEKIDKDEGEDVGEDKDEDEGEDKGEDEGEGKGEDEGEDEGEDKGQDKGEDKGEDEGEDKGEDEGEGEKIPQFFNSLIFQKEDSTKYESLIFIASSDILFRVQIKLKVIEDGFQATISDFQSLQIKSTTQWYQIETKHLVFGDDQIFIVTEGQKFMTFLNNYNDGFSRKFAYIENNFGNNYEYVIWTKNQSVTQSDLTFEKNDLSQPTKQLPYPLIPKSNSFLGVKGCVKCFVAYTQEIINNGEIKIYIVESKIQPIDEKFKKVQINFSEWSEIGTTTDPYFFDNNVWVVFGYPNKQEDQNFLFRVYQISDNPVHYLLTSDQTEENKIKTSYALASIEYQDNLEIIGVGITGDIFTWDLKTRKYKGSSYIKNCNNSEVGEIFHYDQKKWLILVCDDRKVLAYNLQNNSVQNLQTLASIPRFIRTFTNQNLVIFCDKQVGNIYLYKYQKIDQEVFKFNVLITLGRGSLSDQIIYVDLLTNDKLWIQYSYRYDLINITDCLNDTIKCTQCIKKNYFKVSEEPQEFNKHYGDGSFEEPFTSFYNILVTVLTANRYKETFIEVENINVQIDIKPTEIKLILQQSLLNFDYNYKVNLSIQKAEDSYESEIALVLAHETINMSGLNSVRLSNLDIIFDLTNNSKKDCGFSFSSIKSQVVMENIKIQQTDKFNIAKCYSLNIFESELIINNYHLNHLDFTQQESLIFVQNSPLINITDFKLYDCTFGQKFRILNTNNYLKLVGKDIQIENNKYNEVIEDSQIQALFLLSEFDLSNLTIINNQFFNIKIFSTIPSHEIINIIFIFEKILLQNNTFTITTDSSHLFFSSFYSLLPKPSHTLILKESNITDNKFIFLSSTNNINQESITNTATLFQTEKIASITIEQVQFINHNEISLISSWRITDLYINNFDCFNQDDYNNNLANLKSFGCMDFYEVQQLIINNTNIYNKNVVDQNIISIENISYKNANILIINSNFTNLTLIQKQPNTYTNPISIKCNNKARITFENCLFKNNSQVCRQNSVTSSTTALWILNPDGGTFIFFSQFKNSSSNSTYNFIYTQSYNLNIEKTLFEESSFIELDNLHLYKYGNITQNGGFIRGLVISLNLMDVNFNKSISQKGSFLYIESFGKELKIDISRSNFSEGYSVVDGSSMYIDSYKTDLIFNCYDCYFDSLYSVHEFSSAIGLNSKNSTIHFHGGSIKNIFGISQSYFINIQNTQFQIQEIKDIQNERINQYFPTQSTFMNSQKSINTIQGCSFTNMIKSDQYPLLIDSIDSEYQIKESSFQNLKFNTYVIRVNGGMLQIENSVFTNITNIVNNRIRSLQQNSNIGNFENRSMIKVISAELKVVENSNFTKINCSTQCQGSTFYIQKSFFTIKNAVFSESFAHQGGAIFIEGLKQDSNNLISLSSFKKNQSGQQGGSIFLQPNNDDIFEIVIDKCQFSQNESEEKGGAIYIQTSDYSSKNKKIIIKNSLFLDNTAFVGGAISTQLINPKLQNTTFKDNKVSQYGYGENISSYPNKLVLINKQEIMLKHETIKDENKDKFIINNFRSGDNLTTLKFQLQNKDNQTVNQTKFEINYKLTSKISPLTQNQNQYYIRGGLNETKYSLQDCIFEVNQIQIIGIPGSLGIIEFMSDQIKLLDEKSNEFLSNVYSFQLEVHFRKCEQGEYLSKYNQYQECVFCPDNTYSFDSLECSECPEGGICKQGQKIQIKQGYWRENEVSNQIIECINKEQNCLGGLFGNQICKEGNIGPLCEECDNYGEYWDQQYSKYSKYNCISCLNQTKQYWKILISPTWLLISVFLAIRKAEDNAKTKFLSQIFKKKIILTKLQPLQKKNQFQEDQSSTYIKILINYLFIVSSIATFNLKIPSAIIEYPDVVGKPLSNAASSIECFLVDIKSDIPLIYLKAVFSYLVPILVLLLYVIGRLIMKIKKKVNIKYFWHNIINATIFLILYIQPDLVTQMISMVSCIEISEHFYIIGNISYRCYTEQFYFYSFYLIIPNLIFWSLFVPLILFLTLMKSQVNLEKYDFILKYGLLFKEYKKKAYFWEFIKIILKTIIILTLSFYSYDVFLKGTLICVFLICYGYLSNKIKPFEDEYLNKMDLYSTYVSAASIQISVVLYMNKINYLQIFCYIVIILINIWFLFKLFIVILSRMSTRLKKILQKIQKSVYQKFKFLDKATKKDTRKDSLPVRDLQKSKVMKRQFLEQFKQYMALSTEDRQKKIYLIKADYLSKQIIQFNFQHIKYKLRNIELTQMKDEKLVTQQSEDLIITPSLTQVREKSIKNIQNISQDICCSQETHIAPIRVTSYQESNRLLNTNNSKQIQLIEENSTKINVKKNEETSCDNLFLFSEDMLDDKKK